jgi:hypothetical protein
VSEETTQTPVEETRRGRARPRRRAADGGWEPEGLDPEALERRSAALAQVVKFGDPVLRSAASPVTEFD